MDWCEADPDLLVTVSKDMHMYLWNPQTGTWLAEVPLAGSGWPSQVRWCPKNPNLIGCAATDGRISVYALLGGAQATATASPLASPKVGQSGPLATCTKH